MTTPRDDIARLSERLRKRSEPSEYSTGDVLGEEAATQLDSLLKERDALQARVKELKGAFAKLSERAKESETLRKNALTVAEQWQSRALRAEQEREIAQFGFEHELQIKKELADALRKAQQERDEAVAVLNPFMPDPTMMDLLWGDMDDEATGSHTIKLKHFRAARDLVRRLAGPEKS